MFNECFPQPVRKAVGFFLGVAYDFVLGSLKPALIQLIKWFPIDVLSDCSPIWDHWWGLLFPQQVFSIRKVEPSSNFFCLSFNAFYISIKRIWLRIMVLAFQVIL